MGRLEEDSCSELSLTWGFLSDLSHNYLASCQSSLKSLTPSLGRRRMTLVPTPMVTTPSPSWRTLQQREELVRPPVLPLLLPWERKESARTNRAEGRRRLGKSCLSLD